MVAENQRGEEMEIEETLKDMEKKANEAGEDDESISQSIDEDERDPKRRTRR